MPLPKSCLKRRYSINPQSPATTTERNHRIDSVIAFSGGTPVVPKKNTKAPSLIPSPEIDTGIMDIRIIIGRKTISEIKVTSRDMPRART
jgi:hypothetical protein